MTESKIPAAELKVGMLLHDPSLYGTHGDRIEVQWTGHHDRRGRTYDDDAKVSVWS